MNLVNILGKHFPSQSFCILNWFFIIFTLSLTAPHTIGILAISKNKLVCVYLFNTFHIISTFFFLPRLFFFPRNKAFCLLRVSLSPFIDLRPKLKRSASKFWCCFAITRLKDHTASTAMQACAYIKIKMFYWTKKYIKKNPCFSFVFSFSLGRIKCKQNYRKLQLLYSIFSVRSFF